MNASKFAWIYIIEHGVTGVTHSYYGGYDEPCGTCRGGKYVDESEVQKRVIEAKLKILSIGVDWDQTASPIASDYSSFEGTFNDSSTTETLVGTLILKDGTRQEWTADAIEVTNVFEMMANVHQADAKFKTLFGE